MRILMVSTDFPFISDSGTITQGGGGACVAQLTDSLIKRGVEQEVITRQVAGVKKELFGIPIHRTKFYDIGFRESAFTHVMPATKKAAELAKKVHFDIVHTHNPTAALTGCYLNRCYGIPHIMTLHGPWAEVRQGLALRLVAHGFESLSVRCADFVTCDSMALQRDVVENYGVKREKTGYIPNAVDTTRFRPNIASKAVARAKIGLKTKGRVVLYTGRFVAEKGLPYLLEAMKHVLPEHKDVTLLLLGGGFDKGLVDCWLEDNKGVADRISVIPYINYEMMPYAYISSDIFVMPSLAEGMSRSVLEAMACGLPVVATDVGGNVELLKEFGGALVKPRDAGALGGAISKMLDDERGRAVIGRRGREAAVKKFGVDKRADSFMSVYEKILK